jgi:hypothetical protein
MKHLSSLVVSVLSISTFACGGDGGSSSGIDCGNGTEDPTTVDPTCTATVGDARACLRAFAALTDAQICSGSAPAACAAIDACSEDESRESSTVETFVRAHAVISRG